MSFPQVVQNYLAALLAEKIRPFTIMIDRDGRLRDWWGDGAPVGLTRLSEGMDVRDGAPFLHALDITEHVVLPFIVTGADSVFHVHGVPHDEGAYVVFVPATEEWQHQREIQQTTNEVRLMNDQQRKLLDELSKAKRDLEDRERQLTRANEVKARFIAGMSHEFRTPLTAILGYAELILDDDAEETEVVPHTEAIGRAARHLLSMVDNILDQARLEDGSVVVSTTAVNVRELVDDIAAIVAPLAAAKFLGFGAYVATNVPPYVLADVVRVRQVLLNLLGNAIKFTQAGEVRLEIDWDGRDLRAEVSDTGPGIVPEERESIFEEFQRGSGSEHVRGAGLGLNITRRLLEVLDGAIDVESTVGEGSTFSIHLPAPRARRQAEQDGQSTPSSLRPRAPDGCRILVAEDDPDIIALVQIILGRANYTVSVAQNGLDAVEQVLANVPDLVLMDVSMPGLDGLGAARRMRDAGVACPIIALSASLGAADRDVAFQSGFDAYLVKPIAAADLLASIERHLATA